MGRKRLFNDKAKWCNRCKDWLPLDAFGDNKRTASGKSHYCKPCHNAYCGSFQTVKKAQRCPICQRVCAEKLCLRCARGLRLFDMSPDLLVKAEEYLKRLADAANEVPQGSVKDNASRQASAAEHS